MNLKHAAIGVFRCDLCRTKTIGYREELPEGWTEVVRGPDLLFPHINWIEHLCPACTNRK
jgi:hypothetical protein